MEAIHKHLRDRVVVTGHGSGTHVVLWPKKKASEAEIIARAASHGVGIAGISQYFLQPRGAPLGLVLGYSRLKEGEIREGIRRLAPIV